MIEGACMDITRRRFLTASMAASIGVGLSRRGWSQESPPAAAPGNEDGIAWYDVRQWGVEGRGWSDTERYFDRLPARAKGKVRDAVWSLSRHSAGMAARFETDASAIHVRYKLLSAGVAMPHMPATGVSGVDLYADAGAGRWWWLAVSRPESAEVKARLIDGLASGRRGYQLYLPLYNGVESLEIGVPEGAAFAPIAPRTIKPIVYYGTSIAHGACASRPGMAFTSILGRRLDTPVVNLAFSGNGRMEAEVGAFLAELDAAVYCVDCLPNMTGPEVAERAEPLIRQLRAARPEAPIVLVEDRTYANTPLVPANRLRHDASRAALRAAFERAEAAGIAGLHYIEGEHLLGDDGEGTTDNSHPTDLGMMRMADALEPVLRKCLGK
jgi:lysophospholipase L1-like esterase